MGIPAMFNELVGIAPESTALAGVAAALLMAPLLKSFLPWWCRSVLQFCRDSPLQSDARSVAKWCVTDWLNKCVYVAFALMLWAKEMGLIACIVWGLVVLVVEFVRGLAHCDTAMPE